MIGQHIGLDYLMPLALEHLRADPLAEGDYYSGDLLVAVLKAGRDFWCQHADYVAEVADIARRTKRFFDDNEMLMEAYEHFQKDHSFLA